MTTFVEVGKALMAIRDGRLYREQGHVTFEDYCQERWSMTARHARRVMDGANVVQLLSSAPENGTHGSESPTTERQARELVPLARQDEQAVIEVWHELKAEYGEDVTAKKIRYLVVKRLERVKREREAEQRAADPIPTPAVPGIDLRLGDFRTVLADLPDASVDLVFTDPPYPAEYLPLWGDLAALAARILKPGHLLVAYSGQYHLPTVMHALAQKLEYVWLGALWTPGPANQVQQKHIRSTVKPLLFYARGPYVPGPWFEDGYMSDARTKESHDWQQSIGCAESYIARLTDPGAMILDPFLGSGTTALAAKHLARAFIGCDVDLVAFTTAQRRLAE
ncbi:MAG: class I SAM-dependent methyltransferase [Pseudomonadota bacterium]